MLHVDIYCKLPSSHIFLKESKQMEIIGPQLRTVAKVVHNFAAILL
jgi:hypothetical protein